MKRLGLPLDAWPVMDRRLWTEALRRATCVLDDANIASSWRPQTQKTVAIGYALALGWLQRTGSLDPSVSPAARWTDLMVSTYADDLRKRLRPASVKSYLLNLERALTAIDPNEDCAHLRRVIASIEVGTPQGSKRARLKEPAELEELGHVLMAKARTECRSLQYPASVFRDGLQIALLARRPLRRRNFAGIEIGRHL